MCQQGASWNPWVSYRTAPIPTPYITRTPKPGVEKYPFQISDKRLEVDVNINSDHFTKHWLVVKWYNEQSYSSRWNPKWCRSSTINALVERPEHHCGDELVNNKLRLKAFICNYFLGVDKAMASVLLSIISGTWAGENVLEQMRFAQHILTDCSIPSCCSTCFRLEWPSWNSLTMFKWASAVSALS